MTMPRLSLYKPEKGNNYKFIDKTVWSMFQVGGTDVFVHKYLGLGAPAAGTASPSIPQYNALNPLNIQDLLFLENRDRTYDTNIYQLRGVYNVQDTDFNLSQFGLFLQNDTVFISFHINDTVEKLGRKIMSGDVIELPHLKDEYALNDLTFTLKRFYVVQEVNRASEGFSSTWYPHLYRAKCTPMVDSQEFKQILDSAADTANDRGIWAENVTYYPGDVVKGANGLYYNVIVEATNISPPNATYYTLANSLRDIISTYKKELAITQAVLNQAEADVPKSGFDVTRFFTLALDSEGKPALVTADAETIDASTFTISGADGEVTTVDASTVLQTPSQDGYDSTYLIGDGIAPNGAPFTSGTTFPSGNPIDGQFCLRTDFFPNRLFRYSGKRWIKYEDNIRMTMSNIGSTDAATGLTSASGVRLTQKGTFVNNTVVNDVNGNQIEERQSLSKALRPKAD